MINFGLESLKQAVQVDIDDNRYPRKNCEIHLDWIINRAKHYAEKLNVSFEQVLAKWEEYRNYWYINYYQDCSHPLLDNDNVFIYDNHDHFKSLTKKGLFRCPSCNLVSNNPLKCNHENCRWSAGGFFRTMGKGITIVFRDSYTPLHIFKPIYLEKIEEQLHD